jgi:hypothetical protein
MMALIPNHHNDGLITRRSIFIGAASLICAPAIVRVGSLMSVRSFVLPTMEQLYPGRQYAGFVDRLKYAALEGALRGGWDVRRIGTLFGGISEDQARVTVAYARHFRFLPKPKDGFYVEA